MNSPAQGLRVASIIFGLIGLGHLGRLLARIPVHLGNYAIPMWPSVIALIVAGALSIWMWRLSSHRI